MSQRLDAVLDAPEHDPLEPERRLGDGLGRGVMQGRGLEPERRLGDDLAGLGSGLMLMPRDRSADCSVAPAFCSSLAAAFGVALATPFAMTDVAQWLWNRLSQHCNYASTYPSTEQIP